MKFLKKYLKIVTTKEMDFIDLTEFARKFVNKSKVKDGLLTIYSKHTTMAIRINESEKGIRQDLHELLKRLVPKDKYYRHNDLNIRTENLVCDPNASDCLNAHSHCIHFLMGNSETIPICDGGLTLGQWQRIFALELDCARTREVVFMMIGK